MQGNILGSGILIDKKWRHDGRVIKGKDLAFQRDGFNSTKIT